MCTLAGPLGVYRAWPGEACRFGQGMCSALGFGVEASTSLAAIFNRREWVISINRCRFVVQGLGVYTPAEPVMTYEERS